MILNIVVIAIVLLIAYWWANQGFFSSLLHFLCVVVAGGVALAFWEPLSGLLMRGNDFDNYAPGVVLVGLFIVVLLITRMLSDRLVGANVQVAHWGNLVFGGLLGLASGVITMGLLLIGIGHMQLPHELLGYQGFGRLSGSDQPIARIDTMWLPVDKFTSDFYSLLSVTSLSSGKPLALYEPDLYKQANLVRDTYDRGKGQVVMPPEGARLTSVVYSPDLNRIGVGVRFENPAIDFGQQLTLTKSQIRLIAFDAASRSAETYYPDRWTTGDAHYLFDDVLHVITSVPGQESADVIVEFPVPPNHPTPQFVQIRGVRYDLPRIQSVDRDGFLATRLGIKPSETVGSTLDFDRARSIDHLISVSDDIRPVNVGVNQMPSGMEVVDRYLAAGKALFGKGIERAPAKLRVQGIFEIPGTEVVKVDVSRNQPADIFRLRDQVEPDAAIALIDAQGNEYRPIGYMHTRNDGTEIMLDPDRRIRSIAQLPNVPTAGNQRLVLIFYVTEGAELRGLRLGKFAVGRCSVVVDQDD